jgi:hypothetical protein
VRTYLENFVHPVAPFRSVALQGQVGSQAIIDPLGTLLARTLHHHFVGDPPQFASYQSLVKTVVPDVELIHTPMVGDTSATVGLRFTGDDTSYNLWQISSGLKDILVLLAALHFSPRESLVIIEEPENHLHPAAQKALARVLSEVAERDQKQLIVTTHSEVMLNQFPPEKAIFMSREGANATAIPLPKVDVYSVWREMGVERDLLLQLLGRTRQVLVIVEGRDDYSVFEPWWPVVQIADKVIVPRALGGGWREIIDHAAALARALERFRLPSKVFVLLDNDGERDSKRSYLASKEFTDASSHVWVEKEIESYLLLPTALQKISGRSEEEVRCVVSEAGGSGKRRLEMILDRLGMRRTPYHVIMQNALTNAPDEISPEFKDVVERIKRLVG